MHPSTLDLEVLKREVGWPGFEGLLNVQAAAATAGYYALSFVLYAYLPAKEVEGAELANGGRWLYRLNGARASFTCVDAERIANGSD